MTDLHLALFGLGAAIIVAVVITNWWQERKIRKEAAARFAPVETDVLLDEVSEPVVRRVQPSAAPSHVAAESPEEDHSVAAVDGNDDKKEPSIQTWPEIEDDAPSIAQDHLIQTEASAHDDEDSSLYDNARHNLDQPIALQNAPYEEGVTTDEDTEEPWPTMSPEEAEAAMTQAFQEEGRPSQVHQPQDEATDALNLPAPLDLIIDLVGLLHKPKITNDIEIKAFLHALTDVDKTIHVYAKLPQGDWQLVTREYVPPQFTMIAAGIQLADRSGFISKPMLDHFQSQVEQLSKLLSAHLEWLGDPDPWRYASQLDQFCIDVDKLVGFHIVHGHNGPFTGTKFRGLAEANGLQLADDGRFVRYSDDQVCHYTVENHDSLPFSPDMLRNSVIRGVAFKLDIPRVKNCPEVFNQMALIGQHMASHLSAYIHDDNKRPVAEPQFDIVRQQVKMIHAKMVARGVVPGSATAMRLFN